MADCQQDRTRATGLRLWFETLPRISGPLKEGIWEAKTNQQRCEQQAGMEKFATDLGLGMGRSGDEQFGRTQGADGHSLRVNAQQLLLFLHPAAWSQK
jgi:hypothetical protein